MAQKINRVLYAGIFIADDEVSNIIKLIPEEFKSKENYKEMIHPCITLFYWNNIPVDIMKYTLNNNEQPHTIIVNGIIVTDKLVALKVFSCTNSSNTETPTVSKHKNILLAAAKDYTLKDFNSLKDKDFKSITPITLNAYCRIIYKNPKHNEK